MTIQKVLQTIAPIDGWLSSHEGYFLYNVAKKQKGNIVEIGSWKGKSTICLAAGLRGNGTVFAIDPHKGEYSKNTGIRKKAPTFTIFERNIKQAHLAQTVTPLVKTSEEAAKKWKNSFTVLFIDGLHDYHHAHQDFTLWSPLLAKRGVIALHDAFCGHTGPERVVLENILYSANWSGMGVVGSIIYAKKEKPKTIFQKLDKLRYKMLIPMAMRINTWRMHGAVKFFLIHRVCKLLLLNEYTLHLLIYGYE